MSAMAAGDVDDGCAHYRRHAKLLSPCCSKEYYCRFCHDEIEDHKLNRNEVKFLICVRCSSKQTVNRFCGNCGVNFGRYSCLKCRLFDDVDKKQYHCEDCGLCRIGGRENFFHCQICNLCLPNHLKGHHKCIENSSHSDCPICLEDLHTSRTQCLLLTCGHLIHQDCSNVLLASGYLVCPICFERIKT